METLYMFKNLTRLYAGMVMLLCTIILVITTSLSISSLLTYRFPEEMSSVMFERFTSTENFKNSFYDQQKQALLKLSEDELTKKMVNAKQEEIDRQKRNSISNILHFIPWFVVAVLFLLVHVIIYRRARVD